MSFSDEKVEKIWEKGLIIPGYVSAKYRKDACGAWMKREEYGKRGAPLGLGWEVDHIIPQAKGGSDELENLRPLQWRNNAEKKDDKLTCPVGSDREKNVEK